MWRKKNELLYCAPSSIFVITQEVSKFCLRLHAKTIWGKPRNMTIIENFDKSNKH